MDLDIIGIKYLNKIIKKLLNNKNINKEPLNKLIKYILINKQIRGGSKSINSVIRKEYTERVVKIPDSINENCDEKDKIFIIQLEILNNLFNKINNNIPQINKIEIDKIINNISLINNYNCKENAYNYYYKDIIKNKLISINSIIEPNLETNEDNYTYDSSKNIFNDFNLLNNKYLIINKLYSINGGGINSFVYKLLFINKDKDYQKKKAYCLVKSASDDNSDNLYYEYKAGLFLNKFMNIMMKLHGIKQNYIHNIIHYINIYIMKIFT